MKKFIPKPDDISIITSSLAHLLHAGTGTADALFLLGEDAPDSPLGQLLRDMAKKADSGSSLSQCFAAAGVFPAYLCALLAVGERVGKTEQTLTGLSRYYYNMARLRRQLVSSLTYPAVLLCVLLAVLTVLLVWVMPVFDGVYRQLGSGLTGISAGLLKAGVFLRAGLPWILAVAAALGLILALPAVRKALMNGFLKLWGDRGIWKSVNNARFVQALSLGVTSGMTGEDACRMAASVAENITAFQQRCHRCQALLQQGQSLAVALKQCGILSPGQSRLLEAGSRSGKAETALAELAERQLSHSEEQVAALAEKAEPAVVVAACMIIGLVLLSVMLPLTNIMNTIGL